MMSAAPQPQQPSSTVTKGPKDRSPPFPFIPLKTAVDRLAAFEAYFQRHSPPANKVGLAWKMKAASSQAFQTLAALKAFGLLDYQGSGPERLVSISNDGRTLLRAQQDSIKQEVLKRAALKPKVIEAYWREWGAPRPPDALCLDRLVLKGRFTQSAAETFLDVYDATVAYAGLSQADKVEEADLSSAEDKSPPDRNVEVGDLIQAEAPDGVLRFEGPVRVRAIRDFEGRKWVFVEGTETGVPMDETFVESKGAGEGGKAPANPPVLPLETSAGAQPKHGEREWLRGPLSRDTSYRLIVVGELGPREIGKLIKLLQAQQAVLAEEDVEACG